MSLAPAAPPFSLRSTLSIKNAAGQFEALWTSSHLSGQISGKLKATIGERDLSALMNQSSLITIAGGSVNGIVKGYYMGEVSVESGSGTAVMVEVVMDPGALVLEATLKTEEPTLLPMFKSHIAGVLGVALYIN